MVNALNDSKLFKFCLMLWLMNFSHRTSLLHFDYELIGLSGPSVLKRNQRLPNGATHTQSVIRWTVDLMPCRSWRATSVELGARLRESRPCVRMHYQSFDQALFDFHSAFWAPLVFYLVSLPTHNASLTHVWRAWPPRSGIAAAKSWLPMNKRLPTSWVKKLSTFLNTVARMKSHL